MLLRNAWARYLPRASLTILVAVLFQLAPEPTRAQEPIPVEVSAKAELRQEYTAPDGRRMIRFVPAASLQQGDEVFFTLRIRNATPVVAPDVVVTWPIPANTVYQADSASGPAAQVTFSADGGVTFGPAAGVQKMDSAGVLRAAGPEEYTHVRWRLRYPLAPGAVAIARFRATFK